jgi:hypothetical protein
MANRIGNSTKSYNDSSGDQSTDQFLLAPRYSDVEKDFVPSIADWSMKGVPWWRAQTTR